MMRKEQRKGFLGGLHISDLDVLFTTILLNLSFVCSSMNVHYISNFFK